MFNSYETTSGVLVKLLNVNKAKNMFTLISIFRFSRGVRQSLGHRNYYGIWSLRHRDNLPSVGSKHGVLRIARWEGPRSILPGIEEYSRRAKSQTGSLSLASFARSDHLDRPSRFKIGPSDRDDHMETQRRRLRLSSLRGSSDDR